ADLDFTALLGAYGSGERPKNESLDLTQGIMAPCRSHSTCPACAGQGHHDSNDQPPGWASTTERERLQCAITNKEAYQSYIRKSEQYDIVKDPENPYGGYFYRDFERQKIRTVFLNTNELNEVNGIPQFPSYVWTGVRSQAQLNWLANTALQV